MDVAWLVAASDQLCICDACVTLCMEIIEPTPAPPTPPGFEQALAAGLLGQPQAQAVLPALLGRLRSLPPGARAPVVLLVGPPGTGKTHACDILARSCGLPAHHAHSSRLSAVGYVGEQLGNLVGDLQGAGLEPGGVGVLVLDGIDELGRAGGPTSPRQLDGEDVQAELQMLLDDAAITLPRQTQVQVDTRRLLRVLVATLDPLPDTDEQVRAALLAVGVLPGVLARGDELLRFERREPAALAPLIADLALQPEARAVALAAAARGDGAWSLQALRAELWRHAARAPADAGPASLLDLMTWGLL